jgi:hypothetical protein
MFSDPSLNEENYIMQIKSILTAAAIALAATAGSAFADDAFDTLRGVQAGPMNSLELDTVRGAGAPGVIIAGDGADTVIWVDPTGNSPPPIVVDPNGGVHGQDV